jgi:ribosomal protein S18 acetylase RimI-like enzyme
MRRSGALAAVGAGGGFSVDVREMSGHDLAAVAGLCERELMLDRDAGELPAILMRRPHVGLVAAAGSSLLGACFGAAAPPGRGRRTGFIDLLVVDRAARRRGIGAQLAAGVQERLAAGGCRVIAVRGHGVHYAWPGIDVGYTAAICMAEDLGFQRGGCEVDMRVDLRSVPLDTGSAGERLRSAGIVVRRAGAADDGPLQSSLAGDLDPGLDRRAHRRAARRPRRAARRAARAALCRLPRLRREQTARDRPARRCPGPTRVRHRRDLDQAVPGRPARTRPVRR